MKCIYCGTDSRLRARKAGRCPGCRHRFAFEPTTDRLKVTDGQFENAMERVSGNGKVLFTDRHLWYEFNRRWMKPGFWRSPYGALPFAGVGWALFAASAGILNSVAAMAVWMAAGLGAGAALSGLANYRAPRPGKPPRVPFDTFAQQYLGRWHKVHGDIAGLLPARQAAAPAPPRAVPADVAAFSFDRAVVTDRWETAQMLVANRFHFEHNCAVLSLDGYPDGTAGTIKEMLRRNPRLTVFALHDASAGGCQLPLVLREPEWFPDPAVRIVDLGLRPEMAKRLRLPELQGSAIRRPPSLEKMLSADELKWLAAGHSCELAALRPTQVMRAAYRGIVAAGPNDGAPGAGTDGGGASVYPIGMIWVSDAPAGVDTTRTDGFG